MQPLNAIEEAAMFAEYLQAAMSQAEYTRLPESDAYFGEIPGFQGVWASADTQEACQQELQEVLEEWILFRISSHLPLPNVKGLELVYAQEAA
jgi:predicted RNase H-like HicB family nuclease